MSRKKHTGILAMLLLVAVAIVCGGAAAVVEYASQADLNALELRVAALEATGQVAISPDLDRAREAWKLARAAVRRKMESNAWAHGPFPAGKVLRRPRQRVAGTFGSQALWGLGASKGVGIAIDIRDAAQLELVPSTFDAKHMEVTAAGDFIFEFAPTLKDGTRWGAGYFIVHVTMYNRELRIERDVEFFGMAAIR